MVAFALLGGEPALAANSAGAAYKYNAATHVLEVRVYIQPGSSPVDSIQMDFGTATVSTDPSGGVCSSTCPEPDESGSHTAHSATATFSPPATTDPGDYIYLDVEVDQDPGSISVQFNYHDGDSSLATATQCGTLSATPNPLPDGVVGQPYSQQLMGQGGAAPYTYALGGVLPTGVTLSGTGLFSGTPSAGADGAYDGALSIVDANGCSSSQPYQLTIDPAGGGGPDRAVTVSTSLSDLSSGQNAGQSITIAPGSGVSDDITVKPVSTSASHDVSGTVALQLFNGAGCDGDPLESDLVDLQAAASGHGATAHGTILGAGETMAPGVYSVRASYQGDANYDPASDCSETITIMAPPPKHYDLIVTITGPSIGYDVKAHRYSDNSPNWRVTVANSDAATEPSPPTTMTVPSGIPSVLERSCSPTGFARHLECHVPSLQPGAQSVYLITALLRDVESSGAVHRIPNSATVPCGFPEESDCANNQASGSIMIGYAPIAEWGRKGYTEVPDEVIKDLIGSAGPAELARQSPDNAAAAASVPPGDRVASVQVAVRKLGGGCHWLDPHGGFVSGKRSKGGCTAPVWLHATGTTHWRFKIKHGLPAGHYLAYVRATSRAGATDLTFTRKRGNLATITVR
jgi:hypothetical protein